MYIIKLFAETHCVYEFFNLNNTAVKIYITQCHIKIMDYENYTKEINVTVI